MTATELLSSLDSTIARIRETHAGALKELEDRLLATQIELELHKSLHSAACAERDKWFRISTKLVTQFATVEAVFSEAKTLALAFAEEEARTAAAAPPPAAPTPTTTVDPDHGVNPNAVA